jgi:hypothetical protein
LLLVEEPLEVDLAYDVNLAPILLTADEYRRGQEYGTPSYRNVERESVSL